MVGRETGKAAPRGDPVSGASAAMRPPLPESAACRARLGREGPSPKGGAMLLGRGTAGFKCEAPSSPRTYSKDCSLSSMEASLPLCPGGRTQPAGVPASLVQSRCDCLHHGHQLPAEGFHPSILSLPTSTACTTGWRAPEQPGSPSQQTCITQQPLGVCSCLLTIPLPELSPCRSSAPRH